MILVFVLFPDPNPHPQIDCFFNLKLYPYPQSPHFSTMVMLFVLTISPSQLVYPLFESTLMVHPVIFSLLLYAPYYYILCIVCIVHALCYTPRIIIYFVLYMPCVILYTLYCTCPVLYYIFSIRTYIWDEDYI